MPGIDLQSMFIFYFIAFLFFGDYNDIAAKKVMLINDIWFANNAGYRRY